MPVVVNCTVAPKWQSESMATDSYRDWRIFRFIIGRKRLLGSTLAGLILLVFELLAAGPREPRDDLPAASAGHPA